VFRDEAHMRQIGAPNLAQRANEKLRLAVTVARYARDAHQRDQVPIAGVMSPLEHCFRPDLAPAFETALVEHTEIAQALHQAGVDFLLLESMNTVHEAQAAVQAAKATGLPVWVSFVVDSNGNGLSGEPIPELDVDVQLVNCAPPEDIATALHNNPFIKGAYAHLGKFDPPSWKFEFFPQFACTDAWPAERYAHEAAGWHRQIVGACCGGTPEHVRALKA
jgi:S-methylmethionine-dependent homocysteine/selenocysteine methylase